jgi:hypothetical protein
MGFPAPRPIPPRSYALTMQQAADALLLLTPPWYSVWIADGLTTQRYGDMTYQTADDAQAVCDALQAVYDRLLWECRFSVRLRNAERPLPACDARLIGIEKR